MLGGKNVCRSDPIIEVISKHINYALRLLMHCIKSSKLQIVADIEKQKILKQRLLHDLTVTPKPNEVLGAPYLFVLSTGRCGTKLITSLLQASSELLVMHSPQPELEFASSYVHKEIPNTDCLRLAILSSRFDVCFQEAFARGRIYVETNNRITFFAPALAELLPNSKFIHLVRDPRDFVRSGMRRGYYEKGVVQHQRLDGTSNSDWLNYNRQEKIAWEWNEINRFIENFKTQISPDRLLTIKSEYLFENAGATSDIFQFLEINNPFSGTRGEKKLKKILSKPINKQKSGAFPKYEDWGNSEKIALWRIATLAPKYGYFRNS